MKILIEYNLRESPSPDSSVYDCYIDGKYEFTDFKLSFLNKLIEKLKENLK